MCADKYMQLALQLAQSVRGQTSPNPPVGAVVVKGGRIVGMGAHLQAGTAHAEVHALAMAGKAAAGADLYVTLEPCSHHGRTPPCVDLILEKGVRHVWIATVDPNPLVAGKGIERLRQAGVQVEVGLCQQESQALYEPFFHFIATRTPYVTLKFAMTADGKTATYTGSSQWITSPQARTDAHQLRHHHDAILVGINTVLHDDPLLTTRLPQGGKSPIRIVLDTHLRIPETAQVVTDRSVQTIVVCGEQASATKAARLQQQEIEVLRQATTKIMIPPLLQALGARGIMTLLVEGGPK